MYPDGKHKHLSYSISKFYGHGMRWYPVGYENFGAVVPRGAPESLVKAVITIAVCVDGEHQDSTSINH